ncbi:DUF4179 domain-containing protein [Paenibacillus arenilitoris]|uniref:DUF4179 domain-containing protein n=1 Tax=Paenibacillus arenilitoris TaxID=2772299 RepID=A0A927CVK7_9BACL|nr:DUF4179 domain-containing protein [Paenibacillus arenilitoris]MBD2872621.1 DUF4179 domain-containing protein [Paenibacillus arenilitoris]
MMAGEEANTERNERSLRADRERTERELLQLPEEALDTAIRNGLSMGRSRAIRGRRGKIGIGTLAAAMSMLLLLTAFVKVSPAFASIVRDIPGLGGFVELIEGDKSLLSAVNNEFIQPVNASDEKNGYKLTVEGILADEGRLIILYTGEGPGITDQSEIRDFKLMDGGGKDVIGGISTSFFPGGDESEAKPIIHNYVDVVMGEGIPIPERIRFAARLGDQWLEVAFPVEHERFSGMSDTIRVDRSFAIAGQRFTVTDAIITPLQVKLTIESDSANAKRSNLLIDIALVDEMGRKYTSRGGLGELDGKITYLFQSSYFEKPKRLTLVADGLLLSERNKTFVINTDRLATLRTPDGRMRLEEVEDVGDSLKLTILVDGLNETETKLGYDLFKHKGAFKDASGQTHRLLDRDGIKRSIRNTETGSTHLIYYFIPKADYKQPLTFDIKQYPGYALQEVSVPIK